MLQLAITYFALCILVVAVSQINRRIKMRRNSVKDHVAQETYGWDSFWPGHGAAFTLVTDKLAFGLLVFVTSGIFWVDLLSGIGFQISPVSQNATLALTLVVAGNYVLSAWSVIRRRSFEWYSVTVIAALWTAGVALIVIAIDAGVCAEVSNCPIKRG